MVLGICSEAGLTCPTRGNLGKPLRAGGGVVNNRGGRADTTRGVGGALTTGRGCTSGNPPLECYKRR